MQGKGQTWAIVIAGIVAFIWIIPLVGLVLTTIRPAQDIVLGWWRVDHFGLDFSAWREIWTKYPLAQSFLISAEIAGASTLATMILTPAAAYAFHFLNFPFRRTLLIITINAFILPDQIVIIPLFNLWRQLNLIDNLLSVVIPFVGLSFAWSIFLVKNFFEDFPKDIVEAARVDGCGPIATFRHIVLPNSLTPVFAVGILQFLWTWNALLLPMLFLRSESPLPVVLARLAGIYEPNVQLRSVAAIVTVVVPLIIFLLFQNVFAMGAQTRSGAKE
jgi:ABC-type glycerol-3-phosphate transport system permease component